MDKKRILVVDDELEQVEIIKRRLEAEGFDVDAASTGPEAIEKVKQAKPNLILLDVVIPGMDGYEVCATLKADEAYKDIPIIMVTGQRMAKDIKHGMDVGVVSYIQKPFTMGALLGIIKGLVQ